MRDGVLVVQSGQNINITNVTGNINHPSAGNVEIEIGDGRDDGVEIHRRSDNPVFVLNTGLRTYRLSYISDVGGARSKTGPSTNVLRPGEFVELGASRGVITRITA